MKHTKYIGVLVDNNDLSLLIAAITKVPSAEIAAIKNARDSVPAYRPKPVSAEVTNRKGDQ